MRRMVALSSIVLLALVTGCSESKSDASGKSSAKIAEIQKMIEDKTAELKAAAEDQKAPLQAEIEDLQKKLTAAMADAAEAGKEKLGEMADKLNGK